MVRKLPREEGEVIDRAIRAGRCRVCGCVNRKNRRGAGPGSSARRVAMLKAPA